MAYVVVLELDDGTADYKVFSKSTDAVARYESSFRAMRDGTPQKSDGTAIIHCKMFKANTADAREAVSMVKEGKAEPFRKPPSGD